MRFPVRVLMVWCPGWPIRTAQLAQGQPVDEPLALVSKGIVVACSESALSEGVTIGLRVRQAQHRCPDLTVLPHDPDQEARVFEPVLRAIEDRVPGVHLLQPGLAAVRASGASRFYGGEQIAVDVLLEHVHAQGVADARISVADGLFAAEQAAYTALPGESVIVPVGESARFLAGLSIDVFEAGVDAAFFSGRMPGLLRKLGIRDLGALAALPRAQVHNRFGVTGLRAHQLASGEDVPTLVARAVPRELIARTVFEPSCDQVENVIALCSKEIEQLVGTLVDSALVCNEIRCRVHADSGAMQERVWRHPWQFTAADLLDRIRWQLQDLAIQGLDKLDHRGWSDDECLSDGVTLVEVTPESVDAAAHHAEGLWGDRPDEHVVRTVTQLQHQLGYDGVLTCTVGGGRLLNERRILRPWGDALPDARERRTEQPWPGSLPGPAPAAVFTQARVIEVLAEAGEPVTVGSRDALSGTPTWLCLSGTHRSRITAWAGPWPVRQRWWRTAKQQQLSRFQLIDEQTQAWLVLTDGSQWWAEARYD
ncbi:MAG: hypothetical protein JWR35_1287 [Marmoricola sp.]|nr:hypothetical protein [Marmoricola sp.]